MNYASWSFHPPGGWLSGRHVDWIRRNGRRRSCENDGLCMPADQRVVVQASPDGLSDFLLHADSLSHRQSSLGAVLPPMRCAGAVTSRVSNELWRYRQPSRDFQTGGMVAWARKEIRHLVAR